MVGSVEIVDETTPGAPKYDGSSYPTYGGTSGFTAVGLYVADARPSAMIRPPVESISRPFGMNSTREPGSIRSVPPIVYVPLIR